MRSYDFGEELAQMYAAYARPPGGALWSREAARQRLSHEEAKRRAQQDPGKTAHSRLVRSAAGGKRR